MLEPWTAPRTSGILTGTCQQPGSFLHLTVGSKGALVLPYPVQHSASYPIHRKARNGRMERKEQLLEVLNGQV